MLGKGNVFRMFSEIKGYYVKENLSNCLEKEIPTSSIENTHLMFWKMKFLITHIILHDFNIDDIATFFEFIWS